MPTPEIAAIGLKETRKAFKDFGADNAWRAPLREVYRGIGSTVETEAKSRAGQARPTIAGTMATMGGPGIASIKGKGTTTNATISGGAGVAWFGGWNFGTNGAFRQFPRKVDPDYNLYAAVAAKRDEISESFLDQVGDVIEKVMASG